MLQYVHHKCYLFFRTGYLYTWKSAQTNFQRICDILYIIIPTRIPTVFEYFVISTLFLLLQDVYIFLLLKVVHGILLIIFNTWGTFTASRLTWTCTNWKQNSCKELKKFCDVWEECGDGVLD